MFWNLVELVWSRQSLWNRRPWSSVSYHQGKSKQVKPSIQYLPRSAYPTEIHVVTYCRIVQSWFDVITEAPFMNRKNNICLNHMWPEFGHQTIRLYSKDLLHFLVKCPHGTFHMNYRLEITTTINFEFANRHIFDRFTSVDNCQSMIKHCTRSCIIFIAS